MLLSFASKHPRIPLRIDPAQDLARIEQCGQVLRQPSQWLSLPIPLDLALDLLPLGEHLPGRFELAIAVDVRVAADQLRRAGLGDGGEVPLAALLEQEREEDDLEEDVAELVHHRLGVASIGGVGELVSLLDRMRDDRASILLAIPGALAAQAPGDLIEVLERLEVAGRRYPPAPGLAPLAPGVAPPAPGNEKPPGVAGAVAAPGGCGPCGAPPLKEMKGFTDPGAPGVGPLPVH